MSQFPFRAHSLRAFWAIISWPCPIEMLMNDLSIAVLPNFSPTRSTSGVGSTPGKRTKKAGVEEEVSLNIKSMSNEGYCIKSIPRDTVTYSVKAPWRRSGLRALRRRILWNRPMSLKDFGSSAISGFSSPYHFFHYRASDSIADDKFSKVLIV